MRRERFVAAFALSLAFQSLAGWAARPPGTCRTPQSPRDIDPKTAPYSDRSTVSVVREIGWATLIYDPQRGGKTQTLYLCGQHYHVTPENKTGCGAGLVELHHVFAAKLSDKPCDFYHLDCCAGRPVLVLAEQVRKIDPKKEAATGPGWRKADPTRGAQLAEWSGSTTGPSRPDECKPEAEWSFLLGCDRTIDPLSLAAMYGSGQKSRDLQSGNRVSPKLFLVTPPR